MLKLYYQGLADATPVAEFLLYLSSLLDQDCYHFGTEYIFIVNIRCEFCEFLPFW